MAVLRAHDLPELPAGSALQVEETFDGLELHWPNPGGDVAWKRFVAGLLVALAGLWVIGTIFFAGQLARAIGELGGFGDIGLWGVSRVQWGVYVILAIWASLWLLIAVVLALGLFRLLAPRQQERLLLGRRLLEHHQGTPPFRVVTWQWKGVRALFSRRGELLRTDAAKATVKGIGLVEDGLKERLLLDLGTVSVEVGEHLRRDERLWLAQVLRVWLRAR